MQYGGHSDQNAFYAQQQQQMQQQQQQVRRTHL
jgi:hypothetical protein